MINRIKQKIKTYVDFLQFCTPIDTKDAEQAYYLGIDTILKLLKEECYLQVINGTCQSALTEKDIDAIIRRLEAEKNNEEARSK